MNIDKATGVLYRAIVDNIPLKGQPEYIEALQAIEAMTDASEALHKSQRMLELVNRGEFEKKLHGVGLSELIAANKAVLTP